MSASPKSDGFTRILEAGSSSSSGDKQESNNRWDSMPVLDSITSRITGGEFSSTDNSSYGKFATGASWIVNWFLLFAKLYCAIVSSSKAVTAALADSVVDLVSQGILSLADRYISRHSPDYPVGRSRLEALSVLACAFIMSMVSIEVIQYSIMDLIEGFSGRIPYLSVERDLYIIMCVGIFVKFFLWLYCRDISKRFKSDMIHALSEDHFNDVISNSAAMITAAIAYNSPGWWVDPIGAIVISLVIIWRWGTIMNEQVKKIVGFTAPPEYIEQINSIAVEHDVRLELDCTRVYHFGARFNVEMEIVLPADMTVRESHDIALALQHKIEELSDVERAFVHVDHLLRDGLEHKVERALVNSSLQAQAPTTPDSAPVVNALHSRFNKSNNGSTKSNNSESNNDLETGDNL